MYDRYRNVIGIFMNQLQAGKHLTVFGDGSQTRKFSYINDVAYPIAISGIMDHTKGEIFNVGGDIATNVNELAQVVMETWESPNNLQVIHLDARNEVAHAESDHTKLNCFFPNLPEAIGLRDGMQRMVKWAKTVGQYFEPVKFGAVEVLKKMPPSLVTPEMTEVPAFGHDSSDNEVAKKLAAIPSKSERMAAVQSIKQHHSSA